MMQSTWEQRKHIETRIRDLLHLPSDTDLKTVNSMTLLQGCYQYVGERILAAAVKARNVMAGNPCSAETTQKESPKSDQRHILYTTMEILPGRTIANNIQNLPEGKAIESLLTDCGLTLDALENLERDPSLGNGGLGRLAACLLESATAGRIPFTVSVLRFRTGLFRQEIVNGCQTEEDDIWLDENGHYAFEIVHPEEMQAVQFAGQGGKVLLVMIPCDIPMIGADGYCNVIRSWKVGQVLGAVSPEQAAFYHKLDEKLYPDDSQEEGRWLRLAQEYALSAATVGYALDCCKKQGWDIHTLPEHFCYHINDTHAVLMIPECMRRLMKEYSLSYDEAWQIAGRSFVYTNHTILAEALEKWPISLMEARLPEIYGVIHQMHDRFKAEIFKTYDDSEKEEKLKQMAILYDHQVHMAHLAIYASSHVNGVARIHTDILCRRELRAFYEHMPEKFVNVTNGVTQRKFVGHANPPLAQWFTTLTGNQAWRSDLTVLQGMETFAQDPQLQKEFMAIRRWNKERLAKEIWKQRKIDIPVDMIFDVQVKRFHEYKRQQMNALRILALYQRIKANPAYPMAPTAFLFGGKAAASYTQAKLVIRLIHKLEDLINNDPTVNQKLRVAFIPDFNVSKAEWVYAAADVSEQISTASKEASGTGNMKFMMNGALTLGTMDGANVEICDAVGPENMFLFGMSAEEVMALEANPKRYDTKKEWKKDPLLYQAVSMLMDGTLGDPAQWKPLLDEWFYGQNGNPADRYFVFGDFTSYMAAFDRMNQAYQDTADWAKKSILNMARSGYFSSDRMIREYQEKVWKTV